VDSVLSELTQQGRRAQGFAFEITSPEAFLPRATEHLPIDVLVVAFGPIAYQSLEAASLDDHRRMLELNYLLPVSLVNACLPGMIDRGYGRVVLFGGTATERIRGFRTIPAYSAAKTALGSFVKSTAKRLRTPGVTINAVCPDHVHTEYLTETEIQGYAQQMPYGRLIDVDEIAGMVTYLTTDAASSVNGQLLVLDQGRQR
jgi:NAD(P)-dependent dehydrogenase (short-subunit alcohol dehydrogenase family)